MVDVAFVGCFAVGFSGLTGFTGLRGLLGGRLVIVGFDGAVDTVGLEFCTIGWGTTNTGCWGWTGGKV